MPVNQTGSPSLFLNCVFLALGNDGRDQANLVFQVVAKRYDGRWIPVAADIVEYPDSGKIASSHGAGPDRKRHVFLSKDQVDYFQGEE